MGFNMDDYVEVPERIRQFREKHPEGSLQASVIQWPSEFLPFIAVEARAYRTPDDPMPGVGLAWEDYPGKTPYTKGSELMNAETSAWGRALIAVGAADAKKIASAQEVRRSGAAQQQSQPQAETSAAASLRRSQSGGGRKNTPNSSVGSDSGPSPSPTPTVASTLEEPGVGAGAGSLGNEARPTSSAKCAHEWVPATRAGFEMCKVCRDGRRAEKAVLA